MGNEDRDCDGYCWCAETNIRKGMDQNSGKIPGASNINELQKITLLETAHILRRCLSIK